MPALTNGNGYSANLLSDRLPPQNFEAEQGVLGSILLDNDVLDDVTEVLDVGDFYRDSHQTIFRALLAIRDAGKIADAITTADELTRSGGIESVGGIEFITELVNSVPHSANAKYYADIVKQKAVSRRLIEAANDILRDGYSNNFTAEQLLDSAERRILSVADARADGETVRIDSVMPAVMDSIARRSEGEVTGIASGLADLDDVTTGFQPENLIYLAGRTSMGKTSLAINIIDHVAVNLGISVLFVSLEMSRTEIGERLLVARSEVDGHKVRTGNASGPDVYKLADADATIRKAPIFIDDTPGRTVGRIVANARRYHKREGIRLVVVDLINHVTGEGGRDDSRREQMCVISRRFKGLARELKVPVIVLAQLNRGPDNREGNRPRKSDLKECGNLEEDADLVLLLHRPEYYDANDQPGVAVVIVDKNRNGPTRDVRVTFQKNIMCFDNLYPHAAPIDAPEF